MSRAAILALGELSDDQLEHRLRRLAHGAGKLSIESRTLLELCADRLGELAARATQLEAVGASQREVELRRAAATTADIARAVRGTADIEVGDYRDVAEPPPTLRIVHGGRS